MADGRKDHPGVVAPPPLIFGGGLLAALLVEHVLGIDALNLSAAFRYPVAMLLGLGGAVLAALALFGFRRAGTHAEPWKPTTAIVESGVYRLTRNPMYVAMTLIYLALAVFFESLLAVLVLIPVLAAIHFGVIRREERYLEEKFGDSYRAYRQRVRRWI